MEKYVLLKGKIIDKWYDLDETAHFHIIVEALEKNYDIAICLIENDLKINDVIFNSNQEIKRYDEFVIYSRRIKLKQII